MRVRLPRVRFTVRGLMVLVAVAAVVSAGTLWYVERRRRLELAARMSTLEKLYAIRVANFRKSLPNYRSTELWEKAYAHLGKSERQLDYLVRLKVKYERAARYPCLPLEPNPPPPD